MQSRQIDQFFDNSRLQVLSIFYMTILSVGVFLAMLLSDDTQWINWSLSRLGETGSNRWSALAFNSAVFLSSLVMMVIGFLMVRGYSRLGQLRTARLSAWLMTLLMICMLGVSLCPNDTMHAAHFVFSRGIVVLVVVLMFILPSSLSRLTHRERMMSFSFPIFTTLLVVQGYILGDFWFVIVEVVLGLLAAVWLFLACRWIDVKLAKINN